jgi:hypothetical protein
VVPEYRVVEGLDLEAVEKGLDSYSGGSLVTPCVVSECDLPVTVGVSI